MSEETNTLPKETRSERILNGFRKANIEPKLISLAEKAAKLKQYDEAIGILDNLLLLEPEKKEHIAKLYIKFEKLKKDDK